jgi:hypothetical protein
MMSIPQDVLSKAENRLLLSVACRSLSADQVEVVRGLLRQELDWDHVLRLARYHYLAPLLYYHLRAHVPDAVPPPIMARLQQHYLANTGRNLVMTAELKRLGEIFQTHDVTALAYKGPALMEEVYGNVILRPLADLDILVHPKDAARARGILTGNGYRPAEEIPAWLHDRYWGARGEQTFLQIDGKVQVDLHWTLSPDRVGLDLDVERSLAQRVPSQISPHVATLCWEDRLLVLCLHGWKHMWARLEMIGCLAEAIRVAEQREPVDWESLLERSSSSQGLRAMLLSLRVASELAEFQGAPLSLPAQVRQQIEADTVVARLSDQIWQRIFRENDASREPSLMERVAYVLQSQEGLSLRLRSLRAWTRIPMLPEPPDWLKRAEGERRSTLLTHFLYDLFRTTRLVQRGALRLMRRIRR